MVTNKVTGERIKSALVDIFGEDERGHECYVEIGPGNSARIDGTVSLDELAEKINEKLEKESSPAASEVVIKTYYSTQSDTPNLALIDVMRKMNEDPGLDKDSIINIQLVQTSGLRGFVHSATLSVFCMEPISEK